MWLTEQIGGFPPECALQLNIFTPWRICTYKKKGLDTIGRGDAYILVFIKSGANCKVIKLLEHQKNLKTGRVLYLGLELTMYVFKSKSIWWDSPFKRKTLIFLKVNRGFSVGQSVE